MGGPHAAPDTDRGAERGTNDGSVERTSAMVAEDLVLRYPTSDAPAVDCRRIDLPEGAITAIVGPNGSGKSTLLRALADQLEPERGAVVLDGRDLQSYGRKELARSLGHLPQEHDSPESITVEELVYHGRYPHRGVFEAVGPDDRAAVDRAIELAGITGLRGEPVGRLSGGQRQLAWLAMVLAQEADVLLLDEPTTFLDLNHQLRVLETIRRVNGNDGVTVAVVLHDLTHAVRCGDYLVALKGGEVYDWGPPSSVVTEALLADVFDVAATVDRAPDGSLRITPERPLDG